jgi:exopolysaccharide biosynthesis polyprenyl glycosylphosphotransferase
MYRRFSVNFALFSMLLDSVVVALGLAIATSLRPQLDFLPFAADYPELIPTPWLVYPIFELEWVAILLLFSVYDGRKNLRGVEEFINLTLATILACVSMAGTLYLTFRQVSRLLFIVFFILTYLLMLTWRFVARLVMQWRKSGPSGKSRVLIVGSGPVGRELQQQILNNPQLGLQVIGFLDDNPSKRAVDSEILGTLSNIQTVINQQKVDDVVIALPQRAYQRLNNLLGEIHRLPVKVWVIPDYFRMALHKATVEEFAGIPMLDLRAPALNDYQRMTKRAFDLGITILSLIPLLPWMGLIAIAIRLESRGPVLLRQPRAGENGRIFRMYKFRTMIANAEELRYLVEKTDAEGNLIHKSANDPRVTRLGRILRRASMDELPQLFNVLKGEMSLVGPRPELPYLVERYEPWQRQRFAVPQGITGWWQIQGRSDKPMHLSTQDDLYYVQNYSLLLDIYILFKTIGVVWRGTGAF